LGGTMKVWLLAVVFLLASLLTLACSTKYSMPSIPGPAVTATFSFSPTPSGPTNTPTFTLTHTFTITATFSPTPTPTGIWNTSTPTSSPTRTATLPPGGTFTPTFTTTYVVNPPTLGSTITCPFPGSAGLSMVAPNTLAQGAGYVMATQIEVPSYVGIVTASVYLQNAEGLVNIALYWDNGTGLTGTAGNAPNYLVAQSGFQTAVNGWNTLPLPAIYIPGNYYWLVCQMQGTTNAVYNGVGGNSTVYAPYSWTGSFPFTFPSGSVAVPDLMSMFLTYCNENTPTFTPSYTPVPSFTSTPTPTNLSGFTSTPTPTPIVGYDWTEATASAAFSPRVLLSSVVFNNQMWVFGGQNGGGYLYDAWYSSDGINWYNATTTLPFTECSIVVFNNVLWAIEGSNGLFSSTDGINWTQQTPLGLLPYDLSQQTALVYNNKIWVIAGTASGTCISKVCSSPDGINWTQVTAAAAFGPRAGHSSLVYDNEMWVIGGWNGSDVIQDDAWYSSDGVNWTAATTYAEYGPLTNFSAVVYNSQMWLFAGVYNFSPIKCSNFSEYSSDGINWYSYGANPFSVRWDQASVVFNNEMWVIAGSSPTSYLNDVWHSP